MLNVVNPRYRVASSGKTEARHSGERLREDARELANAMSVFPGFADTNIPDYGKLANGGFEGDLCRPVLNDLVWKEAHQIGPERLVYRRLQQKCDHQGKPAGVNRSLKKIATSLSCYQTKLVLTFMRKSKLARLDRKTAKKKCSERELVLRQSIPQSLSS